MINLTTAVGRRALERIQSEQIVWLTTISSNGSPQPRPVWFVWSDGAFLIFSLATTAKIRHARTNPNVSLHFDAGPTSTDVQVFHGEARIDEHAPRVSAQPDYIRKYAASIVEMGMTIESYSAAFCAALRIVPTRLRGLMPIEEELALK